MSALFLAPDFSSLSFRFLHDYVELYLSMRSHVLAFHVLAFDRLRRAVALVLGNRSVLE